VDDGKGDGAQSKREKNNSRSNRDKSAELQFGEQQEKELISEAVTPGLRGRLGGGDGSFRADVQRKSQNPHPCEDRKDAAPKTVPPGNPSATRLLLVLA
jgi:hypothetical protein